LEYGFSLDTGAPFAGASLRALREFLARFALRYDEGIEFTAVIRDPSGHIAATASLHESVIKCVAVDPALLSPTPDEASATADLLELMLVILFVFLRDRQAEGFGLLQEKSAGGQLDEIGAEVFQEFLAVKHLVVALRLLLLETDPRLDFRPFHVHGPDLHDDAVRLEEHHHGCDVHILFLRGDGRRRGRLRLRDGRGRFGGRRGRRVDRRLLGEKPEGDERYEKRG